MVQPAFVKPMFQIKNIFPSKFLSENSNNEDLTTANLSIFQDNEITLLLSFEFITEISLKISKSYTVNYLKFRNFGICTNSVLFVKDIYII